MVAGIGALIGGIGSIASGFMGAEASSEANETNWKINLLNYYARQQERDDRIQQSRQNRSDSKLGSTDANGNRVHFVEGQGWVTDLSDESDRLQDLQRNEQEQVLQKDLPARRQQMEANLRQQGDERYAAEGFMDELRGVQKKDPGQIEALLRSASVRGINEAHDEASSPLLRTALRTGASNIDKVVEGVATSRSNALQKAFEDAQLKALDFVNSDFDKRRSSAATLYNTFAERAGRMPEVSYQPQNPGATATASLSQSSSQEAAAANALAQAFGAQGGTMDYTQPDYGMANAVGSAGQTISGLARGFGAAQGYEGSLSDAFSRYGIDASRLKKNKGGF